MDKPLFEYLLRLGDTTLILSQRLSEWCGHGPALEEDLALTNTALDLLGQARMWLTLAGEVEAPENELRSDVALIGSLAIPLDGLAYIGGQFGMFSMLPVSKEQVVQLREQHAIYMADSGRFNVIGMSDDAVDRFIAAIVETMNG